MKEKAIVLALFILVSQVTLALTDTVDGVTWNYSLSGSKAIIRSPNIRSLQSVTSFSVLPAHDGSLPKILTIPDKLGGHDVYAVDKCAIQISDNTEVETVIVPATVTVADSFIIGEFIKSEYTSSGSNRNYYKWYFRNASEYGLKGILFLGNNHPVSDPYEPGPIVLPDGTAQVTYLVNEKGETSRLWPQCYYVEDVVASFSSWEREVGVRFGAAKVAFLPETCTFAPDLDIRLSCSNAIAKIFYTIDGSDPTTNQTTNCFLYEGPFAISHRTQVKALAYVAEYPYQVVYSNEYALGQTAAPVMTAAEGIVFSWPGNRVTLSCETEDAEIRYTLDGREPTEKSMLYTGPFAIDDTTTVKAKAFKTDWFDSETATATFTREWYTVETPVIEPSDMTFDNVSQEISISCATEGATIFYTTDGSDPAANGLEYKKPFSVYSSCTVRAIAVKNDWKNSAVATSALVRSEGLSEAANFYGYTMETDSVVPWTVVTDVSHDGVSCVRSGVIGHGGTTWLQTSVRKAGTVSFWWKATCEEAEEDDGETYWYDYGSFLVDGVVKAQIAGNDTGWQFVSVDVPSGGKHTLRWEYAKDGATSYAPDCVWLDQVQWIPADGSGYTLTTPEPVPYSWLSGYGLGLDSDFESAAKQSFGKQDGSGRAMQVWQDYVVGTDPTNTTDFLRAVISFTNGAPLVTWSPNLNTNGEVRTYTVLGKTNLTDAAWQSPTNSAHRFFKVKVELP